MWFLLEYNIFLDQFLIEISNKYYKNLFELTMCFNNKKKASIW